MHVNRSYAGEVSHLAGDIFLGREVQAVCRRCARRASIFRTEAPGARTDYVSLCGHSAYRRGCSDLEERNRKLLFHLVSFEEEAARDQGCPPVLCVAPCVCMRVFVCVWNKTGERESERERDTRVKQIGRAAQETAAFGHVLETEAARLQMLHTEK